MSHALLTPEEFSRVVMARLHREMPTARVVMLGQSFLMIQDGGRRRVLSLAGPYRRYTRAPERADSYIEQFLQHAMVVERRRTPSLLEVRAAILPQMLPYALVAESRQDGRELAAVHWVGNLAIGFVIDEDERYSYVHRRLMQRWQVKETDLLALAVRNLQRNSQEIPPPLRIGRGPRLTLIWESFDGFDASRILLTRTLSERAALVEGNPVIAVPHRDYMVLFGDRDPTFVAEMIERVRDEHDNHRFPVSTQLFTLNGLALTTYDGSRRPLRVLQ